MMRRPGGRGTRAVIAAGLATLLLSAFSAVAVEEESEGRLLVLNKKDGTLMVFDVPTHRLLATVAVGAEPHEVAVLPGGRKAYVANNRGGSISVVDLGRYEVIRTIRSPLLDRPHGMEVTPDGRRLLLTSEGNRRLVLIDTARDAILKSISTSQERAHMVAILKGGRRAFVANVGSDSMSVLDLGGFRVQRHVKVGPGPEGIAVTPNGRWVVVALQGSDQVAILDPESLQVVARLPVGRTPVRVAATPNGFTALVSNRGSNDVTVLDLLGRRVRGTVRVGRRPGGLVSDARGSRAYVCNNDSNTVSVISIAGLEVAGEIPTGAQPDGIAFVPRRGGAGHAAVDPRGDRAPGVGR